MVEEARASPRWVVATRAGAVVRGRGGGTGRGGWKRAQSSTRVARRRLRHKSPAEPHKPAPLPLSPMPVATPGADSPVELRHATRTLRCQLRQKRRHSCRSRQSSAPPLVAAHAVAVLRSAVLAMAQGRSCDDEDSRTRHLAQEGVQWVGYRGEWRQRAGVVKRGIRVLRAAAVRCSPPPAVTAAARVLEP